MTPAQQLPLSIPGARAGRFARTSRALAAYDAGRCSGREVNAAFEADTGLSVLVSLMAWPAGEALVRRCVGGAR